MENVYELIGFVLVWLFIIAGFGGCVYLFLAHIVVKVKDNTALVNYLKHKEDFKL
jgi:uncharacterized iron-regulated membrane protein